MCRIVTMITVLGDVQHFKLTNQVHDKIWGYVGMGKYSSHVIYALLNTSTNYWTEGNAE